MKSKKLLSILCLLALTGCGESSISTSSASQSNSVTPSTTSSTVSNTTSSTAPATSVSVSTVIVENTVIVESTVYVEVEKKFNIAVTAAEGTSVVFDDLQEAYSAGSVITFRVNVEKDYLDLDCVKYDGNVIYPNNEGVYSIVVLNKDTTLETFTVNRGEENLLEVSDVNEEVVPQTAEELKAAIENAKVAESKYLSTATYESTYDETKSLKATVGYNGVVEVEGKSLPYSSSNLYSYERVERGFFNDRLYELEEGTTSTTYSKAATVKAIVPDGTENLLATQITNSDAALATSTSGFIDTILKKFFGTSYSFVTTDNYGWKEIQVSSTVSEDNKSYTTTASAYYSSYRRCISFAAEFDGDNFLKNVSFEALDYGYDDIEEYDVTVGEGDDAVTTTYHRPIEGAEPTKTQNVNVNFTRGYRSKVEGTDLSSYATSDYDVSVDYRIPGDYTTYSVGDDNIIYNSAEMKFVFRQKESRPIFFLPTLVGAKEDGFVTFDAYNTPIVSNVGDFTLVFDNGFGELKEVPLTSVRPAAKSMTASLSSSTIYNGESVDVITSITPAGADQSVTVTLKEGSSADVEITQNENGSWSVKGVTNGEGTLVVTSVANEELYKELIFTVEDKPDIDSIKSFLTSTTLFGKLSGWGSHFVNFYEDGTGEYVCYEGSKGNVVPFTWTLDESSISLSIEHDGTKSQYYTISRFEGLTASSVQFVFQYNGSDKDPITLTALDSKLDFATADLSSY